jgi:hypothetical protein
VANKTVVFNNQVYAGTAGLTLLLISPTDGSIGNGSGDTLTAGSNGLFSCVVTENITGWWHVVVKNGATAILEGGQVYFQSNTLGTYYVDGFFNAGSSTWDSQYASHKLASTFGKLMDLLRKANMVVEGTVLASPAPTTTTFNVSGLDYPTGAFEHAVLFFADDSTLAEQNSPILTFTNNGNGTQTIVLEEARTAAPVAGDTVLIDATSHVHAIVDIQAGLATSAGVTSAFTEIKGAGWSSASDTLEKISDSAGTVTISPLAANDVQRVEGTSITLFLGEAIAVGPVAVFDSSTPAAPVNLTSFQPLELVVSKKFGGDIVVIPNASITISGANSNNFSVNSSGGTNIPGIHAWALRKVSTQQVLAYGDWKVLQAAIKDS